MRTVLLALSLLAATGVALVAAPEAQAVGTCTSLENGSAPADGPHCPALFCLGTSWSYGYYYYNCQYQVPPPPPPCACVPLE